MPSRKVLLHLVRHGESAGNVNPAARRSDDPPLTERGREQAARAGAAIARLGVDAVYTSPLRRARETAEAVAAAARAGAVRPVEGFAEVDMGSLSDPETAEGRAEREAIFSAWLAGDRSRAFPGGEDFAAVVRRVGEGLRALAASSPGPRIALVTHRMPIAAAAALCEAGGAPAPSGGCANGSVTTLESEDGARWRLVAWGDAKHLA
jgi:broad specificity phosphatase PhoE